MNNMMHITKECKLVEVSEMLAKSVFDDETYKGQFKAMEEIPFIRKGLVPSDVQFDENEKSVVTYITTNSKDRDGDIMEPDGAVLDHYLKHPVVLWAHDYKQLPIGKAVWLKRHNNGIVSKTMYANHAKAQEVYQYRKDGFPLAESVGFVPLEEGNAKSKGCRRHIKKWLMLEYSDVPVPSNQDALAIAINKGLINPEDADMWDWAQLKTILKGNPSVSDIMFLLEEALARSGRGYVCDMYPVNYPNGYAVISIPSKDEDDTVKQRLREMVEYSWSDGVVTVSEQGTAVQQEYTNKGVIKLVTEESLEAQKSIDDLMVLIEEKDAEIELLSKELDDKLEDNEDKVDVITLKDPELISLSTQDDFNKLSQMVTDGIARKLHEKPLEQAISEAFARVRGKMFLD